MKTESASKYGSVMVCVEDEGLLEIPESNMWFDDGTGVLHVYGEWGSIMFFREKVKFVTRLTNDD